MGQLACGNGNHSPALSALPKQPSYMHATLGAHCQCFAACRFSIKSGQNRSVVLLLGCEALKWGAPGLWVSGGLFRQRRWRMRGSSWGMRVCLLSPGGGIAGGPASYSLPEGSSVHSPAWAPSGTCCGLLLY